MGVLNEGEGADAVDLGGDVPDRALEDRQGESVLGELDTLPVLLALEEEGEDTVSLGGKQVGDCLCAGLLRLQHALLLAAGRRSLVGQAKLASHPWKEAGELHVDGGVLAVLGQLPLRPLVVARSHGEDVAALGEAEDALGVQLLAGVTPGHEGGTRVAGVEAGLPAEVLGTETAWGQDEGY